MAYLMSVTTTSCPAFVPTTTAYAAMLEIGKLLSIVSTVNKRISFFFIMHLSK